MRTKYIHYKFISLKTLKRLVQIDRKAVNTHKFSLVVSHVKYIAVYSRRSSQSVLNSVKSRRKAYCKRKIRIGGRVGTS